MQMMYLKPDHSIHTAFWTASHHLMYTVRLCEPILYFQVTNGAKLKLKILPSSNHTQLYNPLHNPRCTLEEGDYA